MVITKTVLLPYVDFSIERAIRSARRVNPISKANFYYLLEKGNNPCRGDLKAYIMNEHSGGRHVSCGAFKGR